MFKSYSCIWIVEITFGASIASIIGSLMKVSAYTQCCRHIDLTLRLGARDCMLCSPQWRRHSCFRDRNSEHERYIRIPPGRGLIHQEHDGFSHLIISNKYEVYPGNRCSLLRSLCCVQDYNGQEQLSIYCLVSGYYVYNFKTC